LGLRRLASAGRRSSDEALPGEACSLQDERERGLKACAVATAQEQSSPKDEKCQQRKDKLEREHEAHKVNLREGLHGHARTRWLFNERETRWSKGECNL
jgi:hypothetical protein